MSASVFSPDGNIFCKFMTPNFPKPMFFGQSNPGVNGDVDFLFFQRKMSLHQGALGPIFGALGPRLGEACGPWRPKADFLGVPGAEPPAGI